MGKQSIFDKVREWLGGIAFDIFLWSARMTQDEYLDAVVRENGLTPAPADGVGACPNCGSTNETVTCWKCGELKPLR